MAAPCGDYGSCFVTAALLTANAWATGLSSSADGGNDRNSTSPPPKKKKTKIKTTKKPNQPNLNPDFPIDYPPGQGGARYSRCLPPARLGGARPALPRRRAAHKAVAVAGRVRRRARGSPPVTCAAPRTAGPGATTPPPSPTPRGAGGEPRSAPAASEGKQRRAGAPRKLKMSVGEGGLSRGDKPPPHVAAAVSPLLPSPLPPPPCRSPARRYAPRSASRGPARGNLRARLRL